MLKLIIHYNVIDAKLMSVHDINLVYGLPCTYDQLMYIVGEYEWEYRKYRNLEKAIRSKIEECFDEEDWEKLEESSKENFKKTWVNDILNELNLESEFGFEVMVKDVEYTFGYFREDVEYTFGVFRFPNFDDKDKPIAVVGFLVDRLLMSKFYQSTSLNLSIKTLDALRTIWMEFPTGSKRIHELQVFSIPDE